MTGTTPSGGRSHHNGSSDSAARRLRLGESGVDTLALFGVVDVLFVAPLPLPRIVQQGERHELVGLAEGIGGIRRAVGHVELHPIVIDHREFEDEGHLGHLPLHHAADPVSNGLLSAKEAVLARRQRLEDLKKQATTLQHLESTTELVYFDLRPETENFCPSPQLRQIIDYPGASESMAPSPFLDHIHSDDRALFAGTLFDAIRSGTPFCVQTRLTNNRPTTSFPNPRPGPWSDS